MNILNENAKKYVKAIREVEKLGYIVVRRKIFDLKGEKGWTPFNNSPIGEITEDYKIILYNKI